MPFDAELILRECPHLISPVALGKADMGEKFATPPHILYANQVLMRAWATENSRTTMNWPFQHAKTTTCSNYFPAWVLLLWPETRIVLSSYEDGFSAKQGARVRDIVDKFGPAFGINLRKDSKAKNEWVIEKHGGGMVCKGRHGALQGRPADLLLLDDTIKDAQEALSPTTLEALWDWYTTVAFSRLGPTAPIIGVGTRWVPKDWFGRVRAEAKRTGEPWTHVVFRAIAEKDDVLKRPLGAALWPERVPLARLQMVQKERGRWFEPCWQQRPVDEEGSYFKPATWPVYSRAGDGYVYGENSSRKITMRHDLIVMVIADWAATDNRDSDFTAIGTLALTPDGQLLILDVVNERVPLEGVVPLFAKVCRQWRPDLAAAESTSFQGALANECRRYPEIPEVRRLQTGNRRGQKLRRALPAIIMGENHRIYLPWPELDFIQDTRTNLAELIGEKVIERAVWLGRAAPWAPDFLGQLAGFTGMGDDFDDMVDMLGMGAALAQTLRQHQSVHLSQGPCVLLPGPDRY